MTGERMHVLIVGGGLGGLCLAQGLRKAGVEFTLFERDQSRTARLQGFRIRISPDGDWALHTCLPERLFQTYVDTSGQGGDRLTFADEHLAELATIDIPDTESCAVGCNRSVSRITLRNILLDGLDDAVQYGKRFVDFDRHPDGKVTARFEDGTSATGDVLVGADGVNSNVRRRLIPEAADLVDFGVLGVAAKIWLTESTVGLLAEPPLTGPTLVFGPQGRAMWIAQQRFAHSAVAATAGASGRGRAVGTVARSILAEDSADYVFWGFMAARDNFGDDQVRGDAARGAALQATVLGMVGSWNPRIQRLVRASDLETVTTWSMRRAAYVERWPVGPVTLLGDAVHSMPPTGGIGGNTALRDAELLARRLSAVERGEVPLLEAIDGYEAEMFRYGFDAVRRSSALLLNATSLSKVRAFTRSLFFRTVNRLPALKERIFAG